MNDDAGLEPQAAWHGADSLGLQVMRRHAWGRADGLGATKQPLAGPAAAIYRRHDGFSRGHAGMVAREVGGADRWPVVVPAHPVLRRTAERALARSPLPVVSVAAPDHGGYGPGAASPGVPLASSGGPAEVGAAGSDGASAPASGLSASDAWPAGSPGVDKVSIPTMVGVPSSGRAPGAGVSALRDLSPVVARQAAPALGTLRGDHSPGSLAAGLPASTVLSARDGGSTAGPMAADAGGVAAGTRPPVASDEAAVKSVGVSVSVSGAVPTLMLPLAPNGPSASLARAWAADGAWPDSTLYHASLSSRPAIDGGAAAAGEGGVEAGSMSTGWFDAAHVAKTRYGISHAGRIEPVQRVGTPWALSRMALPALTRQSSSVGAARLAPAVPAPAATSITPSWRSVTLPLEAEAHQAPPSAMVSGEAAVPGAADPADGHGAERAVMTTHADASNPAPAAGGMGEFAAGVARGTSALSAPNAPPHEVVADVPATAAWPRGLVQRALAMLRSGWPMHRTISPGDRGAGPDAAGSRSTRSATPAPPSPAPATAAAVTTMAPATGTLPTAWSNAGPVAVLDHEGAQEGAVGSRSASDATAGVSAVVQASPGASGSLPLPIVVPPRHDATGQDPAPAAAGARVINPPAVTGPARVDPDLPVGLAADVTVSRAAAPVAAAWGPLPLTRARGLAPGGTWAGMVSMLARAPAVTSWAGTGDSPWTQTLSMLHRASVWTTDAATVGQPSRGAPGGSRAQPDVADGSWGGLTPSPAGAGFGSQAEAEADAQPVAAAGTFPLPSRAAETSTAEAGGLPVQARHDPAAMHALPLATQEAWGRLARALPGGRPGPATATATPTSAAGSRSVPTDGTGADMMRTASVMRSAAGAGSGPGSADLASSHAGGRSLPWAVTALRHAAAPMPVAGAAIARSPWRPGAPAVPAAVATLLPLAMPTVQTARDVGGVLARDATGVLGSSLAALLPAQEAERQHGLVPAAGNAGPAPAVSAAPAQAASTAPELDDLVERAVQALLLHLDIERERMGFARWS